MANHLDVAKVHAIKSLHQSGWSNRRIAQELGVSRETVRRHLRLAREVSKPAKAPPGFKCRQTPKEAKAPLGSSSKPAKAPPGSDPPVQISRSVCHPFKNTILSKLEAGLSGQRIYQDLVVEHGFSHKYHSVRRFIQKLGYRIPLPMRRMECAPAEEAQVDFGTGAPVASSDGRRKRTHVFRFVLSHSRKAYSEVVYRQTTDAFIQCLENAFWYFGGVTQTVVIDNLRAAVTKADWYEPQLNPRLESFCKHYGTVILPTKSYTPRHKGKTERGIGYVQSNALKARRFDSLSAQNQYLLDWEKSVADTRIHGTTRKQVGKLFEQVERQALQPLPIERFAFFYEAQRSVHRDGHIEVDKAYYSVAPEYVTRKVWVRWDGRLVRIFNQKMEQLCTHSKVEPGQFSTLAHHIHSKKISSVERGAVYLLKKARLVGPQTNRWARAMLEARGIPGVRVLVGLLALTHHYSDEQLERACEIALSHNAFHLRIIRGLIKRGGDRQEQFTFLSEHEIIRDMVEYDDLVHSSFQQTSVKPSNIGVD